MSQVLHSAVNPNKLGFILSIGSIITIVLGSFWVGQKIENYNNRIAIIEQHQTKEPTIEELQEMIDTAIQKWLSNFQDKLTLAFDERYEKKKVNAWN